MRLPRALASVFSLALACACAAPQRIDLDGGGAASADAASLPAAPPLPTAPAARPLPCALLDGPGWAPQPNAPLACRYERARCPDAVFEPRWEPCHGESPATCRRFVHPTGWDCVLDGVTGWHDGERGWMTFSYVFAGRPHAAVVPVDGPAVGAWRSSVRPDDPVGSCRATAAVAGHAILLRTRGRQRGLTHFLAPLAAPTTTIDPLPAPAGVYPWVAGFRRDHVVWTHVRDQLVLYADDTLTPIEREAAPGTRIGELSLAGERVFFAGWTWEVDRATYRVHEVGWDGSITDRYVARQGWTIRSLTADAQRLVWLETRRDREPPYGNFEAEVWIADLGGHGLADARRLETLDVVGMGAPQLGGGMLAFMDRGELVVVDLETDAQARFQSAVLGIEAPLYVSREEVLLLVESRGWTTFYRIDPRELLEGGAP